MGREYVLVNKSRAKAGVRLFDDLDVKRQLIPNNYFELGELGEDAIRYYNQLRPMGLHLVDSEKFFGKTKVKKEEPKEPKEPKEQLIEEDSIEETEEVEEKEVEEKEVEEKEVEEKEVEEKEVEDSDILKYSEEELRDLSEEELRDLAKELGVSNYWNKKEENIIEEILEM